MKLEQNSEGGGFYFILLVARWYSGSYLETVCYFKVWNFVTVNGRTSPVAHIPTQPHMLLLSFFFLSLTYSHIHIHSLPNTPTFPQSGWSTNKLYICTASWWLSRNALRLYTTEDSDPLHLAPYMFMSLYSQHSYLHLLQSPQLLPICPVSAESLLSVAWLSPLLLSYLYMLFGHFLL